MFIKLLECSDNLEEYLDVVSELNSGRSNICSVEQISEALGIRPSNVLTFVGIDNNKIVSTATIIMEKKLRYQRLCCHIEDVAVSKNSRGKGYGKIIVNYCVDVAKSNNCYKIKLNCNKNLVGFYESFGFKTDSSGMVLES
jgi:glucosamine-phosphate N-acetyltransferase